MLSISKPVPIRTLDPYSKRGGNVKLTRFPFPRRFVLPIAFVDHLPTIYNQSRRRCLTGTSRAIITIKPTTALTKVNYSTPRVRAHVMSHKGKCLEAIALRRRNFDEMHVD